MDIPAAWFAVNRPLVREALAVMVADTGYVSGPWRQLAGELAEMAQPISSTLPEAEVRGRVYAYAHLARMAMEQAVNRLEPFPGVQVVHPAPDALPAPVFTLTGELGRLHAPVLWAATLDLQVAIGTNAEENAVLVYADACTYTLATALLGNVEADRR